MAVWVWSNVECFCGIIFRHSKEQNLRQKEMFNTRRFLRKNYAHTLARLKARQFGVTQLSRGRTRLKRYKDDLNAKESWRKRTQSSPSTTKRRGRYFNKNQNFIGPKNKNGQVYFYHYLFIFIYSTVYFRRIRTASASNVSCQTKNSNKNTNNTN